VQLSTNLLLAPIAGYCDVSYRLVVRQQGGLGMGFTDLLCPQGVLRQNYRSMVLAATCLEDAPLGMQLYGNEDDPLCEAARWAQDHGAAVIDLNMGCPVDKITKRNGGSKLLCDPAGAARLAARVVKAVDVPVTAKLRLGWDRQHIVAPQLAAWLEEVGISAITIHGRTADMQFGGKVSLEGIAAVVAAVKRIPVIGNGDVRCPADALRMLEATGCAGVMIGRAALSSPWIFRDTWSYLTTGVVQAAPSIEDKCRIMQRHFVNIIRFRGVRAAIAEMRQRASWYGKQMHPCQMLKERMRWIQTPADLDAVIESFLYWRREVEARAATRP